MSADQNPDDFICRPTEFSRILADGTIEKTFGIRNDWHLTSTRKLGELIVWESPLGQFIKITMEPTE